MAPRLELQTLLLTYVAHAYFQPPPGIQMEYPCIVYVRDDIEMRHANNFPYKHNKRYQLTYIDREPDSTVPDELAKLPLCSFDRHFKANNLNHDVFNLYF